MLGWVKRKIPNFGGTNPPAGPSMSSCYDPVILAKFDFQLPF